jgi:hypothetical protein
MTTRNKRLLVSVPDEMLHQIEDRHNQYQNKHLSETTLELMRLGLEAAIKQEASKNDGKPSKK